MVEQNKNEVDIDFVFEKSREKEKQPSAAQNQYERADLVNMNDEDAEIDDGKGLPEEVK